MNKLFWIKVIAVNGLLSVVLGAFTAHILEGVLTAQRIETFNTAVDYQIYHTLALLGLICIDDKLLAMRWKKYAAVFFLLGIILFCGSLYLLIATNISKLAMLTPLGGLSFMIGWIMLLFAAIREN
ncbi:MAG: DUF423 domain-containing protein [Luminiphilus sp.]|jgi:uncharacterized membrane protein YgdD (TMEM256/DUF423 family)|nr:DUF423 domain-containing protein [Luminiphilus sp.]